MDDRESREGVVWVICAVALAPCLFAAKVIHLAFGPPLDPPRHRTVPFPAPLVFFSLMTLLFSMLGVLQVQHFNQHGYGDTELIHEMLGPVTHSTDRVQIYLRVYITALLSSSVIASDEIPLARILAPALTLVAAALMFVAPRMRTAAPLAWSGGAFAYLTTTLLIEKRFLAFVTTGAIFAMLVACHTAVAPDAFASVLIVAYLCEAAAVAVLLFTPFGVRRLGVIMSEEDDAVLPSWPSLGVRHS